MVSAGSELGSGMASGSVLSSGSALGAADDANPSGSGLDVVSDSSLCAGVFSIVGATCVSPVISAVDCCPSVSAVAKVPYIGMIFVISNTTSIRHSHLPALEKLLCFLFLTCIPHFFDWFHGSTGNLSIYHTSSLMLVTGNQHQKQKNNYGTLPLIAMLTKWSESHIRDILLTETAYAAFQQFPGRIGFYVFINSLFF